MTSQEIYTIGTKLAVKDGCDTPGEKIRSGGKGRGAAVGGGKGPVGVPVDDKNLTNEQRVALEGGRRRLRRAYPGMAVEEALQAEKKQDKIKEAYETGRNLALRDAGLL